MKKQQPGIYCLTNTFANKRFINFTRNIFTYKDNLITKLDRGEYKNIRLLNAWREYRDFFTFEILEEIEDVKSLTERKRYWINYYQSNQIEHGYNLELYKRPWEEQREKWRKIKSWGVDEDVQDFLKSIVRDLDYELEFAEDRINHLDKLLNNKRMKWLLEYVSSPLFCNKQIKNKTDFLAENDISLIGLSYIVDYLVFPKYKNEMEKKKQVAEKHIIRKKKSTINMDHRRNNEKLFGDKSEIENKVSNMKTYSTKSMHEVTPNDIANHCEIEEVYKVILYLRDALGIGLKQEKRNELQEKLIQKYGQKQVAFMKKMLKDLSVEVLIMKEILSGTIKFNHVLSGTTSINYDNDTGYFNDNGDYIKVSENKIDFSKEKHILELLNHYSQLKQRFYDFPDDDMWAILFDLDNLIEKTQFEAYIKDILIMKIDGYQAVEIIKNIASKYGVELTEKRVSEIYNDVIPKMIAETYMQEKEDWIFTYRVKGTYKTCSKCKQNKLAITKYFSPDKTGKDGFLSICKECRK